MTGKVVSWFPERNYGFITPDTGRNGAIGEASNLFFHRTDVVGADVDRGSRVQFETGMHGGRIKAVNVKLTSDSTERSPVSDSPETQAVL